MDSCRKFRYTRPVGITAVGFDLDGTLYPASALGVACAALVARNIRMFTAFSRVRRVLRESPPGGADAHAFKRVQAGMLARETGVTEERAAAWISAVPDAAVAERFSRVRLFPGVTGALAELDRAGLRLGLLSDLPPWRKLELLGLEGRFRATLCSEDHGALKPDPRPFAALCGALGSRPEETLYVGNKRGYDVLGARAAGMRTAIVSRRPVPEAGLSFTDWGDLTRYALSLI